MGGSRTVDLAAARHLPDCTVTSARAENGTGAATGTVDRDL
jgi:hypothetical protein